MKLVSVRKYAIDVEILTIATLLNKKIAIVPVEVHNNNALFSARYIIRMLVDILGIAYRLRIKRWYQKNNVKKNPPNYKPLIRW
jgi:hypothetical protein